MELFGTLVITMGFGQQRNEDDWRRKTVRLHTLHGTLEEVKVAYKAWLGINPALAGLVNARFEVSMAVHQDEL